MNKKSFIIGLILLICVILISIFIVNNIESKNTYKIGEQIVLTNNLKKTLRETVKKDILDSLKTPSRAKFANSKDWYMYIDNNNVIKVKSYVDSQNSYGAMLRANFEQHYILLDKNKYLCIYKEFDNKTQYDITEHAENKNVINKNVTKIQIQEFIKKTEENLYSTLYNKIIDYTFNELTQQLEWNIRITSQIDGDLKSNCYSALTAAIDECVCIPTVNTTINVYYGENNQKIATVRDIDFNFIINKWNGLCYMGINSSHLTTDFEKELGEKLIQGDMIKNMKVDYWNK